MTANIHNAHNPELFHSRSVLKPLSAKEQMLRAQGLCASRPSGPALGCSGQIHVGMFFDGTGNNEDIDYKNVKNPEDFQHSNIVRLYHAYPDLVTRGTNKYYAYYIQGVGTPFKEINDDGGTLGTAAAWDGQPRLIWGLIQMFNAVSDFVADSELISTKEGGAGGRIAQNMGGLFEGKARRHSVFNGEWGSRLKAQVKNRRKDKPRPEQINLSVYGFSRGAAEARAFVTWLYEICDKKDGVYHFCDIPLRVEFLGLFDTVASVGIAGGFTSGLIAAEGRQSWACKNMQVHPKVESCLHIVAAHEVRATFPLDSVRIDGKYPPNCKEYVYPGAHSDVGGGYHPKAYGKTEALARIAGFEMYCAALAQGVPFYSLDELNKDQANVAQNLVPTQKAVDVFTKYMSLAAIKRAPVEDMMRQHMAHYFTYRYQARLDPGNTSAPYYLNRRFFKDSKPNFGDSSKKSTQEYQQDSQQQFIAILAALNAKLDYEMKGSDSKDTYDEYIKQPFQDPLILDWFPDWFLPKYVFAPHEGAVLVAKRSAAITDRFNKNINDKLAYQVQEKIKKWRMWLADHDSPDLMDADAPERDILSVVETLTDTPQADEIIAFFDDWVHDSVAGIAHDKVNEFVLFGIGIAKFRRIYFGDNADDMTQARSKEQNEKRIAIAKAKRTQRAKWDAEAAEYQLMTQGWNSVR